MKKNYLALILTGLVIFPYFAQDEFLRVKNDLKTSDKAIKNSFSVVNENNRNLAIFLEDSENIYGYLHDKNLNRINTLKSENLARKYKQFLGTSIVNNQYNLFIANSKFNAFGMISFSFEKQETKVIELDLELKEESFLQTVSHNNNFYILTATKKGLNLYVFGENGSFEKKHFDFSNEKFLKGVSGYGDLNNTLSGSLTIKKSIYIEKIESTNPNAIESTSGDLKMYIIENKIYLTLDESPYYTQIITIDLNNYTAKLENVKQPYLPSNAQDTYKSNSFLYNKNLLQISATRDAMAFEIKDLDSKDLIKEYKVGREDSITFKNTPIFQIKGKEPEDKDDIGFNFGKYRELEKTQKFLRKITAQRIGISAYKIDGINQITLGGIKVIQSGPMRMSGMGMMPSMMGVPGIPSGGFGTSMYFAPTVFSYNSYNSTISIYIDCLFDDNYNHLEGEIKDNVFDKISDFRSGKEKFIKAETIFKYENALMFGSCLGYCEEYLVMKFKD